MTIESGERQLELPQGTKTRLEEFQHRVRYVKLAEGVLAAVFGLLLSYLGVFILDRFIDTPALVRGAILFGGATGPGLFLPLKWHRWVWRQRHLEQVARLLRDRYPRLSDQLLGVIELAHAESDEDRSERLVQAAMQQVDEQARDRDFTDAVPNPRHRRWGWAAGVTVVLTAGVLIAVTSAGTNALARWLMPWKDTERYTFAQVEGLPDKIIVPIAEPFTVDVSLAAETEWSPETASATYGSQKPIQTDLQDRGYEFQVPPQKKPEELVISVGDAQKSVTIEPTTRPELTEMIANVELPKYLQRPAGQRRDVRGGSVTIVKGAKTTFEASASRELAEGTIDGHAGRVVGRKLVTESLNVTESIVREFMWKDQLGLSMKEPFSLKIHATDDEAPTLTCQKLKDGQILLEKEVLSFDLIALDDFGIRQIGLEWWGVEDPLRNPHPAKGEKIVSAGDPENVHLETQGVISAKREGISPQTLEVRAYAVDYMPGRDRVYSPVYTLYVLSEEEHAIWLTEQFRRWFRKSEEVYTHERQLYETNDELRKLDPDTLDKPETRRRIEAQAAAEEANGRRLTALTDAGEELIQQATRNDQFNVKTLEDWATMLNTLKDIAGNRMPSVSDLLKKAADAPGSGKPGSGKPGSGKPGSGKPGSGKPGSGKPGSGKPGSGKHGEGQPGKGKPKSGEPKAASGSKKESPPQVSENKSEQSGKGGEQKDGPPNKVPGVSDVESGFNPEEEKKPGEPQPPKPGRLTLPGTTLIGDPSKQDDQAEACPVGEKLDEAVKVQKDLLAEFAKVADELQNILGNLEGSTFVKRLKAASRRQIEIADDLNGQLLGDFGEAKTVLKEEQITQAKKIAKREILQSESVETIQSDLEAYFNRVNEGKYKTVFNEMEDAEVVNAMRKIGGAVEKNFSGRSIAQTEFWADSLDRWAEQLVGPG